MKANEFQTERPQRKHNFIKRNRIFKKKDWRYFKILSLFTKIIQIILIIFTFYKYISMICFRSILIPSAIIVLFSNRIFKILDLGIEVQLWSISMVPESLGCILRRLERVLVVKPRFIGCLWFRVLSMLCFFRFIYEMFNFLNNKVLENP